MVKKKQHFVPQCYLKNFANDNGLFVLDKIRKNVYSSNICNVATSNYFYDFPVSFLPEELRGKHLQAIEDYFSIYVELGFNSFLRQIIDCLEMIESKDLDDSIVVLDEEAKNNFSAFLATQLVRTSMLRQQIRGIFQPLDDLQVKIDKSLTNRKDFQEIIFPALCDSNQSVDLNSFFKEGIKEDSVAQHLLFILDILNKGRSAEVAKILSSHIWIFGINSTPISLWTSDSPIVIQPHEDFGTGLASRGVQVVYPISPKYVLIMVESSFGSKAKRFDGMSGTISEKEVTSYNKLQVQQCYSQTYSNKNNFELLLT